MNPPSPQSKPTHKPLAYLRHADANLLGYRLLAYVMALIGGAINAGGFFAVARDTSHMSGELARMADHLYMHEWRVAWVSAVMVLSFVAGACHAAFAILWAKHSRFRSSYALTLWVEAVYMLLFGLLGASLARFQLLVPITVVLMCFIMGMHNTVMTMLSKGVIRSTHMTGFVTDIGIELAKFMFHSLQQKRLSWHSVNQAKFKLCTGLVASFVVGGVLGAWGFHQVQYRFVLPLSALLLLIGLSSVVFEVRLRKRLWKMRKQFKA